jgi:hypothetical protein
MEYVRKFTRVETFLPNVYFANPDNGGLPVSGGHSEQHLPLPDIF